ncbi:MAG: class I SAM-dependent methyltransferase [Chloroflexota bacterium]
MVKLDAHYVDPRLVALYDSENAGRADTDFYVGLAAELDAHVIVDLGCGTGVLTRELATDGRKVIGIDPAAAMLDYAQRQPGAERVEWIEGDASALGSPEADLLVMTGNVSQVFLEDADWQATLTAIHAALHPGGRLAFESRNPEDRAWEQWNRAGSYAKFDSPNGLMESWIEVLSVENDRVLMEGHNVFLATGEVVVAKSELRFRSLEAISRSLTDAGFTMEQVYGDWKKAPFVNSSRMMIFVARRN